MSFKYLMFVVLAFFSLVVSAQTKEMGQLKIVITGDLEQKGAVLLALYDTESNFLKKELVGKSKKVVDGALFFVFDSLKVNQRYAVAVFHDLNGNKKMDKNMFGLPTEPYAFGNNSMGFMGPPNFLDASILIKPTDNVMVIKLE